MLQFLVTTTHGDGDGYLRLPGTPGMNSLVPVYMAESQRSGSVDWDSGNYYGNISNGNISRF